MMTNLQAANAQLINQRRDARSRPRPIADLLAGVETAVSPPPPAREPAARRPQRVTLAQLDTSHAQVAHAVSMARAWAERKRAGHDDASIVFYGPNGVGKTHIARAIWWSIVYTPLDGNGAALEDRQQPAGRFFMANDLIGAMGTTRDADTGLIVPALACSVIGYPPLVVIDDVGAEQVIPFVARDDQAAELAARYFKVIDHCYTGNVSVIITTNLTPLELAARLGRRAWDRLEQMAPRLADGRTFFVDMRAVGSWRRKAGGR